MVPKIKNKKTNDWLVQIHEGIDVDLLALEHGFKNMGKIGSLKDFYLFKKLKSRDYYPHIKTSNKIKFHERQVKRKRYTRLELPINDPLYASQWHLQKTNAKNITLNTAPLWNKGIMGKGVTIGIVDDGLEYNHPDIQSNYNAESSFDFNFNKPNPYPGRHDSHGTASAGCAAAPLNSVCGVG